jgi:hypothetical protein
MMVIEAASPDHAPSRTGEKGEIGKRQVDQEKGRSA